MKRFLLVALLLLGGCAHQPHSVTISGGECKAFERPQYAVKGKKQYDQDWIDSTVEGGVGACGWQRPAARPAALDAPQKVVAKPAAKAKKPTWLQMLHGLKRPAAAPAPAPVASEAPPTEPEPTPAPPPPPAPAPLRPIDKLLGAGK